MLDTYPLTISAFAVGLFLARAIVPDAPIIGTPAAGNGSATMHFAAPAFGGGSSISGYTARCDPGAAVASAAGTPIGVAGLTDNIVSRCAVQASNVVGDGPLSVALSVIPGNYSDSTDLSIKLGNGSGFVGGGLRIGYRIRVDNPGLAAVAGARVSDILEPAGVSDSNSGNNVASDGPDLRGVFQDDFE